MCRCCMPISKGGCEMKKFKGFMLKYGTALSALALFVAASSVNSACYIFYHQPKVPAAMDRFKK